MTKLLPLLAVLASPVSAAPSLEAVHAAAGAALSAPAPFKPFKLASRYVSLSGDARLSGSGFVPHNGGFVSVPLSGQVRVSGDGGQVTGDGTVNQFVSVWVRQGSNYVSQFVSFSATVPLYKQGRYVGTATVNGSVLVSGWATGSYLRLDGTGSVTGSGFVDDRDPQS